MTEPSTHNQVAELQKVKSLLADSDLVLRILEAAGVDKADQFDALVAVQKLAP